MWVNFASVLLNIDSRMLVSKDHKTNGGLHSEH
jgi:hypothetical protein